MALRYRPDAILLDLGLPKADGRGMLDALRDNGHTRHIPVHCVSARDEGEASMQKGALGFLSKPTSTAEIDEVFGKRHDQATAHCGG